MAFIKYNDIENSYRQKYINYMFNRFPELMTCDYVIEHKLDGSNIQFCFTPETTMDTFQICSRNHPLNREGKFLKTNLKELVNKYYGPLFYIQNYCIEQNLTINLYGELFGKNIQNRIDYGNDVYVLFFDIKINGENTSQKELYDFFEYFGISDMLVETFGIMSFEEALDFNTEISSELIENDDHIEGVVIKPWDIPSSFYLKKKNKKFAEKMHRKKIKNIEYSDKVNELKTIFNEYLNENRVLSVFSKEGEIENTSDIGKYIKLVLDDAKEDFFKDGYSFKGFDQKEVKYILNGSKHIVKILQNYL
jgi:hypothetical protein